MLQIGLARPFLTTSEQDKKTTRINYQDKSTAVAAVNHRVTITHSQSFTWFCLHTSLRGIPQFRVTRFLARSLRTLL